MDPDQGWIFCPKCDRHRKPSEFTLMEPSLKWTRVKCLHCGKIFGIFDRPIDDIQ